MFDCDVVFLEGNLSDTSSSGFVSNLTAGVASAGLIGLLTLAWSEMVASIGQVATIFLWCSVILGAPALYILSRRYELILASSGLAGNSRERQLYDQLRANLERGGLPAKIYADRLTRFLAAVDVFFGDSGTNGTRSESVPRTVRAPIWSGASFDRCVQLALVYPLISIFISWAVTGHVGPVERALQFPDDWSVQYRLANIGALIASVFLFWLSLGLRGWWRLQVGLFAAVLAPVGFGPGLAVLGVLAAIGLARLTRFSLLAGDGAIAIAAFVQCVIFAVMQYELASRAHFPVIVIVGIVIFTVICGFVLMSRLLALARWLAFRFGKEDLFPATIALLTAGLCMLAAARWSASAAWHLAGPCILFLGLLTVLNAPFDWFNVGVTRTLMRRGAHRGRWYPYLFALFDAVIATLVTVLLAIALILAIQTFGLMEKIGGGKATIVLGPLIEAFSQNPLSVEYWWIYALLISTMLPSIINLVVASASLLAGVPNFYSLVLRHLPRKHKAIPLVDRIWIVPLLTAQWLVGFVLASAAQGFLFCLLLGKVLPYLGFDLLLMAQWLVSEDVPLRINQVFFP